MIPELSRAVMNKLQTISLERYSQFNIPASFQVETIKGTRVQQDLVCTEITIAIVDSTGERPGYRSMRMIIHESETIPGGFDFLLSADWVIDQRFGIEGKESGYEIRLPRSRLADATVDTSTRSNIALHSIHRNPDPPIPYREQPPE